MWTYTDGPACHRPVAMPSQQRTNPLYGHAILMKEQHTRTVKKSISQFNYLMHTRKGIGKEEREVMCRWNMRKKTLLVM